LGAHNQANMEAAYLAVRPFGVSEADAARAAAAFAPLPHRLEPVGEWGGVLYINDSKATTPDALAAALESAGRPVLLLAGGVFKGGDLARLVPLIRDAVRGISLFGAGREVFEAAWRGAAPICWFPALEPAMRHARGLARPGDAILLAPASASFDLYENYGQRGEDFRRLAERLQ
jgi:UDP-N-acetylmuramoylalanine--D-glutamate ligase